MNTRKTHPVMQKLFEKIGKPDLTLIEFKQEIESFLPIIAECQELQTLKTPEEKGLIIDSMNEKSQTLLHRAALNGVDELVSLLIKAGASPDIVDKEGNTALCLAACGGHAITARHLMVAGANINHKSPKGTALCYAAINGKEVVVDFLLECKGIDIDASGPITGNSPLMFASVSKYNSIVLKLLKAGAEIDRVNLSGNSALHFAASADAEDVAKILIERGANLNQIGFTSKYTPLMLACSNRHIQVPLALIEAGAAFYIPQAKGTALTIAAHFGVEPVVEKILSTSSGLMIIDYLGPNGTALIAASSQGHRTIVWHLLRAKANINSVNEFKSTALLIAAAQGKTEIVSDLVRSGADLELENNKKINPLHAAINNYFSSCANILVKAGADIEKLSAAEESPLDSAIRMYQTTKDTEAKLSEAKASEDNSARNARTNELGAAKALQMNMAEIIETLVEHNAIIRNPTKFQQIIKCFRHKPTMVNFFKARLSEQQNNLKEAVVHYQNSKNQPTAYRRLGQIFEINEDIFSSAHYYMKGMFIEETYSLRLLIRLLHKELSNPQSLLPISVFRAYIEMCMDHLLMVGLRAPALSSEQWSFLMTEALGQASEESRNSIRKISFAMRASRKITDQKSSDADMSTTVVFKTLHGKLARNPIFLNNYLETLEKDSKVESANLIADYCDDIDLDGDIESYTSAILSSAFSSRDEEKESANISNRSQDSFAILESASLKKR